MFVSRLIAVLFVVVVGAFVALATIFRDPADTATRLAVDLDIQSIELATEPLDALAAGFDEGDLAASATVLRTEITDLVTQMLLENLQVGLTRAQVSDMVGAEVADHLDAEAVESLASLLAPADQDAAADPEGTRVSVLALSEEEQRTVNFGDALGQIAIEALLAVQRENGPLATALNEAELPPMQDAVRPRLTRLQRIAYRTIVQENYTPRIEATGATEVTRRAQVRARTSSPVEAIFVDKGDFVERGQTLATLHEDGRNAQRLQAEASIAQAEAGLQSAQAALNSADAQISQAETSLADANESRSDILDLGDFASDTQRRNAEFGVTQALDSLNVAASGRAQAEAGLAEARANLESAKANLVQIDLDIDRLVIRAPYAGRIEQRAVELGSLVNAGEELFTLADMDPMVVTAAVSDRVRQTLRLGDQVDLTIGDGPTALALRGPITLIDTTSNAATRTFEVEVEVANPRIDGQPQIADNQFATLTLASPPRPMYRIPQSALTSASLELDEDGTTGLLLVGADDRVKFVEITFADYNDGGELLIDAARLGAGPIRLIVGRGGFVKIGDLVNPREQK